MTFVTELQIRFQLTSNPAKQPENVSTQKRVAWVYKASSHVYNSSGLKWYTFTLQFLLALSNA